MQQHSRHCKIVGIMAQSCWITAGKEGNLYKIKRHLSTRYKAIEKWPGINVFLIETSTCLSCKAGHMHSNSMLSAMSTVYTL